MGAGGLEPSTSGPCLTPFQATLGQAVTLPSSERHHLRQRAVPPAPRGPTKPLEATWSRHPLGTVGITRPLLPRGGDHLSLVGLDGSQGDTGARGQHKPRAVLVLGQVLRSPVYKAFLPAQTGGPPPRQSLPPPATRLPAPLNNEVPTQALGQLSCRTYLSAGRGRWTSCRTCPQGGQWTQGWGPARKTTSSAAPPARPNAPGSPEHPGSHGPPSCPRPASPCSGPVSP